MSYVYTVQTNLPLSISEDLIQKIQKTFLKFHNILDVQVNKVNKLDSEKADFNLEIRLRFSKLNENQQSQILNALKELNEGLLPSPVVLAGNIYDINFLFNSRTKPALPAENDIGNIISQMEEYIYDVETWVKNQKVSTRNRPKWWRCFCEDLGTQLAELIYGTKGTAYIKEIDGLASEIEASRRKKELNG